MLTDSQVRWVRHQPLAVQLAAVEAVWHGRAEAMVIESDRLWSVGREHDALDEVVRFAEDAADICGRLGGRSEFSRFARSRIVEVAGGAVMQAAVMHYLCMQGHSDHRGFEVLRKACAALGLRL